MVWEHTLNTAPTWKLGSSCSLNSWLQKQCLELLMLKQIADHPFLSFLPYGFSIQNFRDPSRDQTSDFRSRDDYVNTAFVDWVQKWPGQVVIGIFNLFWTAEVNEALVERGNAGLVDYATKLDNTLTEIATWRFRARNQRSFGDRSSWTLVTIFSYSLCHWVLGMLHVCVHVICSR